MKRKLKISSVVASTLLASLATPVLAEEVATPADTETSNATIQVTPTVTAEDVRIATSTANEAKTNFDKQTEVVAQAQDAVASAETATSTAKANVVEAASTAVSATPEAVQAAEQAVLDAQEEVQSSKASVSAANENIALASKAVDAQASVVANAEKQASVAAAEKMSAEAGVATAQEAVNSATTAASVAETVAKSKTEAVATANETLQSAKAALESAQAADQETSMAIAKLNTDKGVVETKISSAQAEVNALQSATNAEVFVTDATFTLSAEYVAALKQREIYMGDPAKAEGTNEIDLTNPAHQSNDALLKSLGKTLSAMNQYTSTDGREVNIWNLTESQQKEINFFALDIVNQIRTAFGNAPIDTTQGMLDFANEVAKKRSKTDTGDAGHQYSVINDAADKYGLSAHPNRTTDQNQSDIVVMEDMYSEVRAVQYDVNRPPMITMGALKSYIYEGFKTLMFNNVYQNSKQTRNWELSLSTAGGYYRTNSKYVGTSVSASISKPTAYTNKYNETTYFSHFTLFLHTFQTNGESTDPFDMNKIVDSSKFDATVLKNEVDQEALAKYNKAVQTLTVAQTELATINQQLQELSTKSSDVATALAKVSSAETALNTAKAEEAQAKVTLQSAQAKLTTVENSLLLAQESLVTATESDRLAKDNLATEKALLASLQSILTSLKQTLSLTEQEVSAKEVAVIEAEKRLTALLNAKANLVTAQEQYDAALANKEQLDQVLRLAVEKLVELERVNAIAQDNLARILVTYNEQNPVSSTGNELPLKHFLPEAKIEIKEIQFETIYEDDPSLPAGQERLVQEGKNGQVQVLAVPVRNVDGTYSYQLTEILVNEKVNRLVKRGTRVNEGSAVVVVPSAKQPVSTTPRTIVTNSASTLPTTGEKFSVGSLIGIGLLSAIFYIGKRRRNEN
ncbi:TPA: SEC10/PgrA surface exclusion domain-containing protein [Streptococcus suis]